MLSTVHTHKALALLTILGGLGAAACGSGSNNGTNKPDSGMMPPTNFVCADQADLTICDLKLQGGAKQPPIGDPVVINNVVVTSPIFVVSAATSTDGMDLLGFYAQDQSTTDDLDGRYSGILVTFRRGALTDPTQGNVVQITGTFTEFPNMGAVRQKQIQATFLTVTGAGAAVPVAIPDATTVATGGVDAAPYDGVLLSIAGATAVEVGKVAGPPGKEIFGAFKISGGLVIGSEQYEYPASMNEEFTSIVGILKTGTFSFDLGISQLMPRGPADVVPTIPAIGTIAALQDPAAPGRPSICQNMGTPPTGCAKVDFNGVVVTAARAFVSSRRNMQNESVVTRAFYIQDPNVVGGRFSGVAVIYTEGQVAYEPMIGDVLRVTGESVEYFRNMQITKAGWTKSGTANVPPAVIVTPAEIARSSDPGTNPWEGVLVRAENLTVIERCIDSTGTTPRDFGNWIVTGPIYMGVQFTYSYNGTYNNVQGNCSEMVRANDLRMVGDTFSSITGVVNYSFNELRLEPRSDADLAR